MIYKLEQMIEKSRKHYYLTFTIVFIFVSAIAFSPFLLNNRLPIWTAEIRDGLEQHYNALMYVGKWWREIIKNIFIDHTFEIPMWDFSFGYGGDIISTLHYYAIGDPLDLMSIFVPSRYTEYLYSFLAVFRIYLAGIAFSMYGFYMKKEKMGVFCGSFIYMFSGYVLYAFSLHAFFTNPMIYFPLLLIAAEKLLNKNKPLMLIIVVFVMTLCSFYFSYMMLLLLVFYVAIRFLCSPHKHFFLEGIKYLLMFAGGIIVGLMMAGLILIPNVLNLFSGNRITGEVFVDLFYDTLQNERNIALLISAGNWGQWFCLGFAPVAVLSVILLFVKKKQYIELKIGVVLLTIFMIFPFFGHLFNGMSYVVNRWIFSYAFLVAFIFTVMWKDLIYLTKREKIILLVVSIIYFSVLLIINGTNENTMASLSVLFLTLCFLIVELPEMKYKILCRNTISFVVIFSSIVLSISVNTKYEYGIADSNYMNNFIDSGKARETLYQTGDYAIRQVDDDLNNIERIDQPDGLFNSSWQNGTYGLSYYGSLENGSIIEYMNEMGISSFYSTVYQNLDSRTMLNAVASVKYFVNETIEELLPYGYEEIAEINVDQGNKTKEYFIAENKFALPLGYTYDSYIIKEDYDKLNPIQKQQALMQGAVLNESAKKIKETDINYSEEKKNYKISCSDGVQKIDDKYIATKSGAQLILEFDGSDECETYILLSNMSIEGLSEKDLYFDDYDMCYSEDDWNNLSVLRKRELNYDDKYYREPTKYNIKFETQYSTETIGFLTEKSQYYHNQTEYMANLGYHKKGISSVIITLPSRGVYDLSSLEVYCQPMEAYADNVDNLRKDTLKDEIVDTNRIQGTIELSEDKILCLSIPYGTGWTAYVDGHEAEILQCNTMFMAIPMSAGEHEIELVYFTPGLYIGMWVSIAGIFVFIIIIILEKSKYKRKTRI